MLTCDNKAFKLFINILYDEILEEFLLQDRNESEKLKFTFLINWNQIIQNITESIKNFIKIISCWLFI